MTHGLREARPLRRVARLLLGFCMLLSLAVMAGCSTYANDSLKIRQSVSTGDLQGALQLVTARGGDDPDVLDLLERGLLLYYDGQYTAAATSFETAAVKIDDLYTKSISKEAAAFLTNDATLPYTGYPAEQVLLHTYAALSYLADGKLNEALVATRAASHRLQLLESQREDKEAYDDDAFAEWIAAMLYAEDDDANACLVSCRRALSAFREFGELWGQNIPRGFLEDYVVWARRYGFGEEAAELVEEFGAEVGSARDFIADEGEVLLIYESGFVDHLEEARLDFPIFKNDNSDDDEWATNVYSRGTRETYVARRGQEVDYWLSIASPFLARTPTQLARARISSGEVEAETELVHNISAVFGLTFREGSAKRLIRTIARVFAKQQAVKLVKDKSGDDAKGQILGFAANLFASATERADTRSWSMLPDRIHVARMRLPAGTHRIDLEVLGNAGSIGQSLSFEDVVVVPGSRTILHYRSFR